MISVRTLLLPRALLVSLLGVSSAYVLRPAEAQVASPVPSKPRPANSTVLSVESPLSLTGSDGSGLQLVSLKARALIEDPLAFTELHLVFHNPEGRQREGRFRITLPPGATVSRFAMKIAGRWMEGEVVERQAARRAYEDFLHRRQDPALMENEAGNEFSARVFPIPPGGDKELIVSYSQELTASRDAYRLPLRGLPSMGELDIRVLVGSAERQPAAGSNLGGASVRQETIEIHKRNYRPDRDLEIAQRGAEARLGLRHDNLVVARVQPLANTKDGADPIRSLLVLVDTSASRALGFETQLATLTQVLGAAAARGDFDLQVLAFDQAAEFVYAGRASGWGDDDVRRVLQRRAEGASNLQQALASVLERYKGKAAFDRLLIVSDGVVTAGSEQGDELRAQLKTLATLGIARADVLGVGGIRDDARLSLLARAGLARDGAVLRDTMDASEAARRLLTATHSGIKLTLPGARWIWPETLDGVQPGDEVLVYADLPSPAPFALQLGGQPLSIANLPLVSVERPLLERAWVKARIARLSQQRDTLAAGDADLRAALSKQIIELSTRFRVLCDGTALLVLETEADYARFGIERRALADILTLGASGLEVVNRVAAWPTIATRGDTQEVPAEARAAGKSAQRQPPPSASPRKALASASMELAVPSTASDEVAAESPSADEAQMDRRAKSAHLRGRVTQTVSATASRGMGRGASVPAQAFAPQVPAPEAVARPALRAAEPKLESGPRAMTGELAEIEAAIATGHAQDAFDRALRWRTRDLGDVLAIVALGRALEALGKKAEALRVYGSVVDLFPARADLRRFAAGYLEHLQLPAARALALDSLHHAVEDRPDHPSGHHLLGMALLENGQPSEAFDAIERGLKVDYPAGRFAGVGRILREDLGLCAAAWTRKNPERRAEIEQRLRAAGGEREDGASVRFVLTWETDANDVDFHIRDARGGHANYANPQLPSGGELYADVTTGYGPECFTVRDPQNRDVAPYRLQAHYYSRGPMGYGMGQLEIIDHDAHGNFHFESRPFVVMNDGAFLDLGTYDNTRSR